MWTDAALGVVVLIFLSQLIEKYVFTSLKKSQESLIKA